MSLEHENEPPILAAAVIRGPSLPGNRRPQAKEWSTAAIGLDRQVWVLFLHSRDPWSTHDFIEALRRLPLALSRAMYVEGGPEAQLYVRHGGRELVGSYESGFHESDDNPAAWPVPNVIGVAPRR